MLIRRSLLAAALAPALTTISISAAQAQAIGPEQGVTAARGAAGGHLLRFSRDAAATYRTIAGRRVTVGCSRVQRAGGGYTTVSEMTTVVRAPKRRGALKTYAAGRADYCFVETRGRSKSLVAIAPVTEAGRTWLDEMRTVGLMMLPFLLIDAPAPTDKPPSTEQAIGAGKGFVVALQGPDATPPAGKVGYWSDGRRAVAAAVSAKGRRLFFEIDGDVIRTNVYAYLNED